MDEYIEREALINELLSNAFTDDLYGMGLTRGIEISVAAAKRINAANVSPVRHAKVIDKISDDHETVKPWEYRYYCSACKILMRDSWNKYCPNCGAKMDLGAE